MIRYEIPSCRYSSVIASICQLLEVPYPRQNLLSTPTYYVSQVFRAKIVLSPMVASSVRMGCMISEWFTHMCLGIKPGTHKKAKDLCLEMKSEMSSCLITITKSC